jgi:hypothetical protein
VPDELLLPLLPLPPLPIPLPPEPLLLPELEPVVPLLVLNVVTCPMPEKKGEQETRT